MVYHTDADGQGHADQPDADLFPSASVQRDGEQGVVEKGIALAVGFSRFLPLLMERPVAHPIEQRHSAALNHGLSLSPRGRLRERHLGGLFTWMAPRLVA